MVEFFKNLFYLKYLPNLNSNVSFWALLVFGLLTSIHCMGMCGGLVLSQCINKNSVGETSKDKGSGHGRIFIPTAFYNVGRLLSYAVIGGIVGGVGQVLSLPTFMKGIIPIAGGLFMLIMAFNLLGIFAPLRRLNFAPPKFIAKRVAKSVMRGTNKSPFVIGLLTGLMPCGPLQIVELYTLGTKSVFYGAASMFVFALGTVPGLFAFGVAGSLLTRQFQKVVLRISAVVVAILGILMIYRGLSLEGVTMPSFIGDTKTSSGYTVSVVETNDKEIFQTVTIKIGENYFPPIEVKKDIPVRWVIYVGKDVYCDCNNEIVARAFNIDKKLVVGDNVVEFTPHSTGEYAYTCWMGMIKSKIRVVSSSSTMTSSVSTAAIVKQYISSSISRQSEVLCSKSSTAALTSSIAVNSAHVAAAASSSKPQTYATSRVSSVTSSKPATLANFTGYLIDEDCFVRTEYKNPANETNGCLTMSSCAASGYGIAVHQSDGTYKFYYFDGFIATDTGNVPKGATCGQKKARDFINTEILDVNIPVTVTGTLSDATGTNPSTDSADGIRYPVINVSSISKQ